MKVWLSLLLGLFFVAPALVQATPTTRPHRQSTTKPAPSTRPVSSKTKVPQTPKSMTVSQLRSACDKGLQSSCLELGRRLTEQGQRLRYGRGVKPSWKQAGKLFHKACHRRNYAPACYHLGFLLLRGSKAKQHRIYAEAAWKHACALRHVKSCMQQGLVEYRRDLKKKAGFSYGSRWFNTACHRKHGRGCYYLGIQTLRGLGQKKNPKQALRYFQFSCRYGDKAGCAQLGFAYNYGRISVKKDYKQALHWYMKACQLSSGSSCRRAGLLWERGRGIQRSPAQALHYYRFGCAYRDRTACYRLGKLLFLGKGEPKNDAQAVKAFGQACRLRHRVACANQGLMYEQGWGVKKSLLWALISYKKACKLRDGIGCTKAGLLYQYGAKGIPIQCRKAAVYFLKGCRRKDGVACNQLGVLYHLGTCDYQDKRQAFYFYRRACQLRTYEGCLNQRLVSKPGN